MAKKDLNQIEKVLLIYESADLVFLSKEEDRLVNEQFRDTMPVSWNWDSGNPNLFIRYNLAGISFEK